MFYRTRTYLAGDWDGDSDLIQQIYRWKENGYLSLDFSDAHDLTQARNESLNCTIKASLAERMNRSNTFVLIVGEKTNTVTSGSCQYCGDYRDSYWGCARGHATDLRSYVKFECEKAANNYRKGEMRIVVIYNYLVVHKEKCPETVRGIGTHIPGITRDAAGNFKFDYQTIKCAIMNLY